MASNNIPLGHDTSSGKNYKVMIIDDSSTIRMVLRQILLSESFDIIFEAENGKNALSKLSVTNILPDIIFLDIQMPKMDGLDFLKKLKQQNKTSKIVIISSMSDKKTLENFISLGINSYIVKPIERKIFLEHVARVLNRKDYFY